jgi:hypothetical protein
MVFRISCTLKFATEITNCIKDVNYFNCKRKNWLKFAIVAYTYSSGKRWMFLLLYLTFNEFRFCTYKNMLVCLIGS